MQNFNHKNLIDAAIYSLSFLWIFTGITSIFFSSEIGYEILLKANIEGVFASLLLWGGGLLDIIIGLWLLTRVKLKACCLAQIGIIVIYTILLTIIDYSFWLHPFGPITKNFPIIILILFITKNIHEKY